MPNLRPKLQGRDHRLGGSDPIPPGRWYYVGAADAPAFQNSWANAGAGNRQLRFRRTNENQVEIVGSITGGADGTVVFSLAGWWYPDEQEWLVGATDDSTVVVFRIQADGDVVFVGEVGGGTGVGPSTAGDGLAESSGVLSVNVDNTTVEISTDAIRVKDDGITAAKIAANAVTESEISLSDVTSDNVTSTAHGFAPKSPADSTKFLDGSATPAWDTVKDSDLSTSDITTNDVSTTKHGFTPKAPNDTAKYLRGDGTWAVPTAGGVGGIPVATIDAKGDLIVGSAADTVDRLAVGSNDTVLVADSAQTLGVKWAAVPGTSAFVPHTIIDAKGDLIVGTAADTTARKAVGSNGKLLVAASGQSDGLLWDTGYLGGLELVYKYTVSGSVKASIDTGSDTAQAGTNDWTNGDVLEIFIYARCDNAATTATLNATVNNDTSSVYDRTFINNTNATVTGSNSLAQAAWALGVAGDNASTGTFASLSFWLPNYTGTVGNKQMNSMGGTLGQTAATATITNQNFTWRPASPAAITRFKIIPASGNLKIGSQLLIYKRRNA